MIEDKSINFIPKGVISELFPLSKVYFHSDHAENSTPNYILGVNVHALAVLQTASSLDLFGDYVLHKF